MLVQVLFHTSARDVEIIDVITLEPAAALGEDRRGTPLSLALRTTETPDEGLTEAVARFDRWAAGMCVVGIELERVDGEECLTVVDGDGDAVVLQISG